MQPARRGIAPEDSGEIVRFVRRPGERAPGAVVDNPRRAEGGSGFQEEQSKPSFGAAEHMGGIRAKFAEFPKAVFTERVVRNGREEMNIFRPQPAHGDCGIGFRPGVADAKTVRLFEAVGVPAVEPH